MKLLDISEVARRSGVKASALRYYEDKGLIASVGRRGIRRLFEPVVLQRLALIRLGQAGGFSLDELAAMLPPDDAPTIDRDALLAKADDLDQTIRRLSAMRDALRHAAACPAPSHFECATFQRYLKVAAKGGLPAAVPPLQA
ncbi:helix-turn-helix domain-containing protein [Novosphingobium mangrovi (ex Huang et al. 2023)]|uniref:Helix-turn-helix domain-containing protein n=1 Tax=Novosphingobium mangrovi (ex Huang et al. 2023) TaxID=2976432 RepID=A0ABT2I5D6_9SPHN|nr:helix-turn-helix domain-containing protein [Novosphingobium mangrovi (ex Huang et al. 2023)]MCT2399762.1 helix-turn-helix domain-containing protein [Novosphingobium mangrovi (ex Huang et al. 2023)]